MGFFGLTRTPEGVNPDNKIVAPILAMTPPKTVRMTSLPSFLELPDEELKPVNNNHCTLWLVFKERKAFLWGPEHDHAFQAVK